MLGLRVPATPDVARAVRLTYGFQFFFGLLLWIPVFYEYQKQLGLSDAEIFGIQSIYYIAFCLLEIPTGMVADRFDYRTSLWLGASVLVVANLVPVLAGNYTGFLVHFLLIALARSLISGAQSAYLYEYLHAHDAGHLYLKVEGVGRSYSLVGKIVYWPVIGLLMQWNMPSPYWLTAINAAIAVVLALRLPPIPGWQRPEGKTAKLLAGVGGAFGSLRTSRWLLLLMIQGIAMFTLVRILQVNLFQPVLESKDVSVGWYGSVLAAMTIFEAIAAARPHWLSRRIGSARSVFLLTVVMALAIGFIVPSGGVVTIVLLCLFSVTAGMSFPIQKKLLNDAIPDSRYRATLLSMESIMDRAVCAIVAVALGAYLAGGRLNEFLVLSSVVTVIMMALLAGLLIAVRTTRRRRAQLVP
ncbi:MFS transporter [Lentzea sp. BCCO 10_0061]|uniref:MFS transporter n=1 Tax=Lentzea sokolovensis TaxID=3095429 RepID=A0ABU4V5Q9_9PSEU|nr:MFS transporter [Lentzea sp. BCCO 10_0061]MDX8146225.1 MFS transporter [Lentzea sp. BCCO 10_0061]